MESVRRYERTLRPHFYLSDGCWWVTYPTHNVVSNFDWNKALKFVTYMDETYNKRRPLDTDPRP